MIHKSHHEHQQEEEEERRDLLVLLREQQTVTGKDLLDRENRRLLHFLMYEHKIGISMPELQHHIRSSPLAEEPRPLYVEFE